MIGAGELKKGIAIELDGKIYQIIEYQHVKMQQRQPVIKLKLRDLHSDHVIERNFQSSDKFKPAFLEHRLVQYLYNDGDLYYFMDTENYEQLMIPANQVTDDLNYFKEGLNLEILTCEDKVVSLELPTTVELRVIETEPGFKGDRATAGTKPAKMETGFVVQVPLFINENDVLKIDTRSGEYLEKVT
ncbi:MAG: elongation factor P [Chloroflexota bacterium]|nr:elongation factor P [Chloroflexota bacterium]